jgi:hypothetical protein
MMSSYFDVNAVSIHRPRPRCPPCRVALDQRSSQSPLDRLPAIAMRLHDLVPFLRSAGVPRGHALTAEDAADLLDAYVTGQGSRDETGACDEVPALRPLTRRG